MSRVEISGVSCLHIPQFTSRYFMSRLEAFKVFSHFIAPTLPLWIVIAHPSSARLSRTSQCT